MKETRTEIIKACCWNLGEIPPGEPKNKDFFEADAARVEEYANQKVKEAVGPLVHALIACIADIGVLKANNSRTKYKFTPDGETLARTALESYRSKNLSGDGGVLK